MGCVPVTTPVGSGSPSRPGRPGSLSNGRTAAGPTRQYAVHRPPWRSTRHTRRRSALNHVSASGPASPAAVSHVRLKYSPPSRHVAPARHTRPAAPHRRRDEVPGGRVLVQAERLAQCRIGEHPFHKVVPDRRRRAGDAAHLLHRVAVGVTGPYTGHQAAQITDRPVVPEIVRGAGFGRGGRLSLSGLAAPGRRTFGVPRHVISEDVRDLEHGGGGDSLRRRLHRFPVSAARRPPGGRGVRRRQDRLGITICPSLDQCGVG